MSHPVFMDQFQSISVNEAKQLIESQPVILADIRDAGSYQTRHIEGAIHLTNDNLADFIRDSDLDRPVIVYCFHGHASQPASQLLLEQGFEKVYSLTGGFKAWEEIDRFDD